MHEKRLDQKEHNIEIGVLEMFDKFLILRVLGYDSYYIEHINNDCGLPI